MAAAAAGPQPGRPVNQAGDRPRIQQNKHKDTLLATQGLVFFGTPHNGAKDPVVNIGHSAANIALKLGIKDGNNIIDAIKSGTLFSDLMSELYRQRLLDYPIVSFWGAFDSVSSMVLSLH